jgi:multidrug efflux pump
MSAEGRPNRFADMFVKMPVLALVVNVALLLFGLRAVTDLPVQQYPRIESSSIVVTTIYIGASAENIRGFITTPIERAVSAISGVDYVESDSVAGLSTVTVRLKLNHPSTVALAEIGNRLDQIRNELPTESEPPTVQVVRADRPYATFYVSVTSDAMTPPQLTDYLTRNVQPKMTTLPGVQRIGFEGERPLAMRIWLNNDKMASFGISPQQVQDALVNNNFLAAVGQIKSGVVQVDLLANTDLRTVPEFEQLIIRQNANGTVRIKDIARVELGSEEPTSRVRYNGKDAVYLSVWPLPGSNEINLAKALRKMVDEIRPTLPPTTEINIAYDGATYMENAIQEIFKTLAETVAIVGLVVFLFLGSFRTALVPLIAIPVSLISTTAIMLALGFSLNLLTLLAIVLAVGLVVDDAIVVVENVARLLREGKTRFQAALMSARQLFTPIIAMTITLAVVYAPIGLLTGLTGVLFKEFAFTLAIAVIMSGVVAVTLSPIMSARILPAGGRESKMANFVNHLFERVRHRYERILDKILGARLPVIAFGVFITIMIAPLYLFSGKELAPVEDEGFIFIIGNAPPDASLDYTSEKMLEPLKIGEKLPEFGSMFQLITPSSAFGGYLLKPWHDRSRASQQIQPEVFGSFTGVAGLQLFALLPPPLPGAGNYDVEMVVRGNASPEEMAGYAARIVGAAFGSGVFMFADTDLKIDLPQVRMSIDRERVADLGLDLAEVGRQLGFLLAGNYVNRFNYEGHAYKVVPQVEKIDRSAATQLLDYKIQTPSGGIVTLASLVKLDVVAAPRKLTRFQQADSFRVFGGVIPGNTKDAALAKLEAEAKKILPAGFTIDYAGESRQIRQEGNTLLGTMAFAFALIYLVLAAQFNSFRDPLVVLMGSVPLALGGALVFTFLGFTTINIYSQIGLITLIGLIAKNGILIVEFAKHQQEQGMTRQQAAREAALARLRPVLMTTAATIFGHLPLVFVTGAGAEARNSIGVMLVTGMFIGTLFTLIILPALYSLLAEDRHGKAPVEETEELPHVRAHLPTR